MANSLLTRMLFAVVCGLGAALWTGAGQAQVVEEIRPGRAHRIFIPGAEPVVVYSATPTPAPSVTPYGARGRSVTPYGARGPSLAPYRAPAPSVMPYGPPAPTYGPRYYSASPEVEPEPIYVAPRPIVERTRNYFRRQPVRNALRALAP